MPTIATCFRWSLLVVVLTSALLTGCGTSALPPPVSVSFRGSLIGMGKACYHYEQLKPPFLQRESRRPEL